MATFHVQVDGDQLTCTVCMELFTEPVTLGCGHSFCHECVEKYWKSRRRIAAFICPNCREVYPQKPKLKKSVILATLVEEVNLAKEIKGLSCTKHGKVLKLYCKFDKSLMCMKCMAGDDQEHDVVPVEVAHARLKEELTLEASRMQELLKNRRSRIMQLQRMRNRVQCSDKQSKKMLEQKQRELYRAVDVVVDLQKRSISERHKEELSCIEQQKEILQQETDALQEAVSALHKVLHEKEAIPFLQSHKDLHSRQQFVPCSPPPHAPSSIVLDFSREEWKLDSLIQLNKNFLQEIEGFPISIELMMNQQRIADLERSTLKRRYGQTPSMDPSSVNAGIKISQDLTTATRVTRVQHSYPEPPHQFDFYPQVLSCESFSFGRHYWEVDVSSSCSCRIGVALNSIERKGAGKECLLGSNPSSWCLEKRNNKYSAWHNDEETPLSLPGNPERFGFFLDCEGGELTCFGGSRVLYVFSGNFKNSVKPALLISFGNWSNFFYSLVDLNYASVQFCSF